MPTRAKTAVRGSRCRRSVQVAVLGLSLLLPNKAFAQTTPSGDPGWRLALTPYVWVPAVSAQLRYSLPGPARGARVNVDSFSVLEALNFAAMVAAEARHGRYSLSADFIYLDLGNANSAVRSVDFFQLGRNQLSSSLNANTQSSLRGGLGTLAAGYTLADGAWGHVDGQVGVRVLSLTANTQVRLSADIIGPGLGLTFSRNARLSRNETLTDGTVGVRGRFVLGSGFYLPYAFDVGTGSSQLTWQALGGISYQAGGYGVTAGYRHLSYQQGGNALVRDLSLGGPFVALNITF